MQKQWENWLKKQVSPATGGFVPPGLPGHSPDIGLPFDPEGLLSTLPSIVNVLGGYLVGKYIIDGGLNFEKLSKLMLVGVSLLVLAYLWDFSFPVNKKLWTSSFVILTIGFDILLLSALIYFVDLKEKPINFKFFEIFGMNSLFIYLLSEYLAIGMRFIRMSEDTSLYRFVYLIGFSWIDPYYGAFAFALVFMFLCWAAGWWLDRKKIYIKV